MVELADASDSKSDDGNIMWVQVPLPAPHVNYAHPKQYWFITTNDLGMYIYNQ